MACGTRGVLFQFLRLCTTCQCTNHPTVYNLRMFSSAYAEHASAHNKHPICRLDLCMDVYTGLKACSTGAQVAKHHDQARDGHLFKPHQGHLLPPWTDGSLLVYTHPRPSPAASHTAEGVCQEGGGQHLPRQHLPQEVPPRPFALRQEGRRLAPVRLVLAVLPVC